MFLPFWDPTMILLIPAMILAFYAQWKVQSTYRKFSEIASASGRSGREIAQLILRQNGITDVEVEEGNGFLSDHYDPLSKRVRLSPHNYSEPSISALAVSAHEVGHAIQHEKAYAPFRVRSAMWPAVAFASQAWLFILMIGLFAQIAGVMTFAIILFAVVVLFQLVTLPVEFDASRRAMAQVSDLGLVSSGESQGARQVLTAAAMTYVAAALAALSQLAYWLLILNRR